jgi:divalent metal cation (Fe/Co/Zn/Cd) transporter
MSPCDLAWLGDALHNAADTLTAVLLGVAFVAGRRPPTRRYTCGYRRAEDLAGIAIVMTVAASSAPAAYAAITRLLHARHAPRAHTEPIVIGARETADFVTERH